MWGEAGELELLPAARPAEVLFREFSTSRSSAHREGSTSTCRERTAMFVLMLIIRNLVKFRWRYPKHLSTCTTLSS